MFSANIGYGLSGFVLAIKCFHTGSDSAPVKVWSATTLTSVVNVTPSAALSLHIVYMPGNIAATVNCWTSGSELVLGTPSLSTKSTRKTLLWLLLFIVSNKSLNLDPRSNPFSSKFIVVTNNSSIESTTPAIFSSIVVLSPGL